MVAIGAADGSSSYEGDPLEQEPLLATQPVVYDASTPIAHAAGEGGKKAARPRRWFIWWQAALVSLLVVYLVAHTIFTAPFVQLELMNRLGNWWTEPPTTPGGEPKIHAEMMRPSVLFLFCVVPFAVGTVTLEWMRGPPGFHRAVSHQVLRLGVVLRRKPSTARRSLEWLRAFSYGELLFLSMLVVGNLVLAVLGWFTMLHYYPLPGTVYTKFTTLEILGIVLGYNSVYNMAFLFLPTTRSSTWMEFMAISYANGMKFHRWLGVATLATAVGHALPFYPVWYHQGVLWVKAMPCFDCSLDYLSIGYPAWFNVFGEISLAFMLVLGVTSLPWIRRVQYETFYYMHYLFVPGVIFAVLHWGTIVWWLLPTFTIYLVDRIFGSVNAVAPVPIHECTELLDGIVKVVVTRSTLTEGHFEVGQFVYLNVPAISKWQWHAFTIGSSPRGSPTSFTVWLKSLGDWTENLVRYTRECEAQRQVPVMYVDGYYGASLEAYDQYASLCLVGGGIGVTPLFAMLEDIACRVQDLSTVWPSTRRIHFVFSFREVALLSEIHEVLQVLRTNAQTRDLFTFEFFLTRPPSDTVLDAVIPTSTKGAAAHPQVATSDAVSTTHRSACPFAQPMKSSTYRAVLYATVIVGASAAIVYLDYDGGVMMDYGAKTQYWPLQNLVDGMVLFAIPLVAYAFMALEKTVTRWRGHDQPEVTTPALVPGLQDARQWRVSGGGGEATDIRTYRDLVAEYDVSIGTRPNMVSAMGKVHAYFEGTRRCDTRQRGSTKTPKLSELIGVFVSGPEALKRAVENAVAAIDSRCFDIHDEEFEL